MPCLRTCIWGPAQQHAAPTPTPPHPGIKLPPRAPGAAANNGGSGSPARLPARRPPQSEHYYDPGGTSGGSFPPRAPEMTGAWGARRCAGGQMYSRPAQQPLQSLANAYMPCCWCMQCST